MTQAIVLGANSDIYKSIAPLMKADGWRAAEVTRSGPALSLLPNWDVCLVMIGRVAPVGMWWETEPDEWEECMSANLLTPLRLLRRLWKKHNLGASVIWMAGSNPNSIMDGYSAYNTSKMALLKCIEQLDHETRDAKFVAVGPGTVLTKIHSATRDKGWPNQKLQRAQADPSRLPAVTAPRIWECIKWCVAQPKEVVGGRNICVSDPFGDMLRGELVRSPETYKLRRKERSL
jgi:NAD(P)-dependent dehydrogenase (short-subunit alcohol dehydrogenase family)